MLYRNPDRSVDKGTEEFWRGVSKHVRGSDKDKILVTLTGSIDEKELIDIREFPNRNVEYITDDPETGSKALDVIQDGKVIVSSLKDVRDDTTHYYGLVSLEFDETCSIDAAIDEATDTIVKSAKKDATFHISISDMGVGYPEVQELANHVIGAEKALVEGSKNDFGHHFVNLFAGVKAPWNKNIDSKSHTALMFDSMAEIPESNKEAFTNVSEERRIVLAKSLFFASKLTKAMYYKNRACAVYGISAENDGGKCRFHCYGVTRHRQISTNKTEKRKAQEFMTSGAIAPMFNYYTKE